MGSNGDNRYAARICTGNGNNDLLASCDPNRTVDYQGNPASRYARGNQAND